MRAIVIDAYDSFVYIICQYLMEAGVHVDVVRNDQLDLPQIEYFAPDLIVLGRVRGILPKPVMWS